MTIDRHFTVNFGGASAVPSRSLLRHARTRVAIEVLRQLASDPNSNVTDAIDRVIGRAPILPDVGRLPVLRSVMETSLHHAGLASWVVPWMTSGSRIRRSMAKLAISRYARRSGASYSLVRQKLSIQPRADRSDQLNPSATTELTRSLGVLIADVRRPPSVRVISVSQAGEQDDSTIPELMRRLEREGFITSWTKTGDPAWGQSVSKSTIPTGRPIRLGWSGGFGYSAVSYSRQFPDALMETEALFDARNIGDPDFVVLIDPAMASATIRDNEATVRSLKTLCSDSLVKWAAVSSGPSLSSNALRNLEDASASDITHRMTRWVGRLDTFTGLGGAIALPEAGGIISTAFTMLGGVHGVVESNGRPLEGAHVDTDEILSERRELLKSGILWDAEVNSVSLIVAVTEESVQWLEQALNSVRLQQCDGIDVEVCLQFDGTIEQAERAGLQRVLDRFPEMNLSVGINRRSCGISATRNAALMRSRSDVIATLDSDDTFSSPHVIRRLVEHFRNNPECGWVAGASTPWIADEGSGQHELPDWQRRPDYRPQPESSAGRHVKFGKSTDDSWWAIAHKAEDPLLAWRRELIIGLGGWPAFARHEDWALMAASARLCPGIVDETPMRDYRIWGGQTTKSRNDTLASYSDGQTFADDVARVLSKRVGLRTDWPFSL